MSKKIEPRILRFVSMLFLILEKEMSKEIAPGTLSFVDRLFLIFEKRINKKIVQRILILTIVF